MINNALVGATTIHTIPSIADSRCAIIRTAKSVEY